MAILGVNTFLWTTEWRDRRRAAALLGRIRHLGFDAVQIPLLSIESVDSRWLRKEISSAGLRCYISAGLKPQTDVTSADPEKRTAGVRYLKNCLRVAREMGCSFLSGSYHSVFGMRSEKPVTEDMWRRSAECLQEVALEARRLDMDLVLEPINRYESFLVNTASQAERLIDLIGEPNVKIQLDTFHMNLEEDDPVRAIRSTGGRLLHFHVAENHRGRFGEGTIPWDRIFEALVAAGYSGAVVIESFVPTVTEVASAACIWRRMAASADDLASEGAVFLRKLAEEHGL